MRSAPLAQTDGGLAAKVTGRGEVVVALTVNGGSLTSFSPSGPKVIVWLPSATVKDWVTWGAGA